MRSTSLSEYPVRAELPGVQHRSVPRSARATSMPGYHDAAYWFQVYHPEAERRGGHTAAPLSAPRKVTSEPGGGIGLLELTGIRALLILIVVVCIVHIPVVLPSATTPSTSASVRHISQLDPSQYDAPPFDVNTWWGSACSATAITMVIDAYSHSYRIADILRVEVRLHEITVADGLLHSSGIDRTVAKFGFRAPWLQPGSLDQVIATANSGKPVIANLRGPNFPTGHFQVVEGGSSTQVYVADSSRLNMTVWTRQAFSSYYTSLTVVVEPAA
jgi:hypothetical protein